MRELKILVQGTNGYLTEYTMSKYEFENLDAISSVRSIASGYYYGTGTCGGWNATVSEDKIIKLGNCFVNSKSVTSTARLTVLYR